MRTLHPLPVVPDHEVRWGIADGVLVILGAHLLAVVWASMLVAAGVVTAEQAPYPPEQLVVAGLGLWAGFVLGPVLVARAKGRSPIGDYGVGLAPIDVPLGVGAALITNLALLPVLYAGIGLVWDTDPEAPARSQVDAVDGLGPWLLFAVAVAGLVPVVEEYAYRGLFLRSLQRRLGPWPALAVSSVVFALFHATSGWIVVPGIFVFALVAGGLVLWTGRLGTSVVMHMAFNGTTLIALALF